MIGERRPLFLPAIVVLVGAGTLALGALTPRDLSAGEDAPVWNTDPSLVAYDVSRLVTALLLFSSAVQVTLAVARRGLPRAGLSLWLTYLAFVATNFVLPGFAGTEPGLDVRLLLPPLVFSAIYLARPASTESLVALCKGALLAFVYASLAGAVLSPSRAIAAGYSGLLPGLDFRLYGIGGGATSLGTLSAAYLAVELVSPSRSRLRFLHAAAAAFALLLTQAKTSWLFVLLFVGVWSYRRLRHRLPSLVVGEGASAGAAKALLASVGAVAVGALAVSAAGRVDAASLSGGENLVTLTGRTYIWTTSFRAWLDAPWFGYGIGLWETPRFVAAHGAFDHAHNQFLHSLASGGVFGLLGLLAYMGAGLGVSVRVLRVTPVPLVLLAGVVFLCLTNTPLRAYYLLDAFTLLHLLLFASLVHAARLGQEAA